MALQFRIRLLFSLTLIILNGSVLSAQVSTVIPTPVKITSNNPSYILASEFNPSSIYLHCAVSTNVTASLKNDLQTNFYDFDDDDDYIDHDEAYNEEVLKYYYQQYQKQNQNTSSSSKTKNIKSNASKKRNRVNDSNHYEISDDSREVDQSTNKEMSVRRVRRQTGSEIISYEWLKNDNSFISTNNSNDLVTRDNYTLFSNGTIKFMPNDRMSGVYRCKVTYSYEYVSIQKEPKKFEIGPAFSTATKVELAAFISEDTGEKSISSVTGDSVVLPCPIKSIPEANFTWSFKNKDIVFDIGLKNTERRHYLLKNGSLLIVNTQVSDSGKYRCNGSNQYLPIRLYSSKYSFINFFVVSRNDNDDNDQQILKDVLLPIIQNSTLKIKSGENLVLHCAARHTRNISWTFLPRNANSNRTIKLGEFVNELRYVNVSESKHDGIYNCSTDIDSQIFDVSILTPPTITSSLNSRDSSFASWVILNCTVSGHPMPTIEWYRNGELIKNNPMKWSKSEMLKIESIEPQDEGLYQCIARNDFGEAIGTMYLHVRLTHLLNYAPYKIKCSSIDDNAILIYFEKRENEKITGINYYVAADDLQVTNGLISQLLGGTSFNITKNSVKTVKSLKPFHLYLRSMLYSKATITMSPLSKPVICAFQQIKPIFVKLQNGTFLRWVIDDLDDEDLNKATITIQFQKNGTNEALTFSNEVIGTYVKFGDYVMWSDIEKNLEKVSVNSSDHGEWTEIKVSGNVTGILIIKVEDISVRILGAIEEDGKFLEQDYTNLRWQNSKLSFTLLEVNSIEARSVIISWNGLGKVTCMKACTYLKQNTLVQLREPKTKLNCEEIPDPSAKSFYIRHLQPTSNYDVFIKDCNENYLTTETNFQTLRDVPGPVQKAQFKIEKGIVLNWSAPSNPNGAIQGYFVEWTINNVTFNATINETSFRFPNTKDTDRFNISVRAIGEGGIGHPLIIDPSRSSMLPVDIYAQNNHNPQYMSLSIDSFVIFGIIFISLLLCMFVIGYVLCRKHRYCKNSNGIINNEQSSFSPTTSPVMGDNIRSDEMYEMQTLISPTTQSTSILVNGRDNVAKTENLSNGDVINIENQKILRTSTPTEEMKTIGEMCDEPPIKCDNEMSQIHIFERKPNGFLKTFQSITPTMMASVTPEKNIMKVNGNSSPYKCLQSSVNDQNSSSASSSFGSSHRQLIDINSLCNGLNNNNNNSHHSRDRSKIGKSSSIETDNDDEDSEENLHEYDLNDSNISSKPLHPISGWNFRQQPLVGPNG